MKPELELTEITAGELSINEKEVVMYYFVRHRSLTNSDTFGQVIAIKDQKQLLNLAKEGYDLIEVTKL